jgi:hypothetical protein
MDFVGIEGPVQRGVGVFPVSLLMRLGLLVLGNSRLIALIHVAIPVLLLFLHLVLAGGMELVAFLVLGRHDNLRGKKDVRVRNEKFEWLLGWDLGIGFRIKD